MGCYLKHVYNYLKYDNYYKSILNYKNCHIFKSSIQTCMQNPKPKEDKKPTYSSVLSRKLLPEERNITIGDGAVILCGVGRSRPAPREDGYNFMYDIPSSLLVKLSVLLCLTHKERERDIERYTKYSFMQYIILELLTHKT